MDYLLNDHKDHLNQQKYSHKLCDEIVHRILIMTEGQWKPRHQHDQNFSMGCRGYHSRTNTGARRNK